MTRTCVVVVCLILACTAALSAAEEPSGDGRSTALVPAGALGRPSPQGAPWAPLGRRSVRGTAVLAPKAWKKLDSGAQGAAGDGDRAGGGAASSADCRHQRGASCSAQLKGVSLVLLVAPTLTLLLLGL